MKNKLYWKLWLLASIILASYFAGISLILFTDKREIINYTLIGILTMLLFAYFISVFYNLRKIKSKRELIANSFDKYVEEEISKTGSGMIIVNDSSEIIWCSKFIERRLNKKIIGKKINSISKSFDLEYKKGNKLFNFEFNGIYFHVKTENVNNTFILKDITSEKTLLKTYSNGKSVIGEMEIDNFQQLQVIHPGDELFKIQSIVIKMLDSISSNYNFTYKQYVNGKFLLFLDEETLKRFIEEKFNFIDELKKVDVQKEFKITVSIGFGLGSPKILDIVKFAKEGLMQSLSRGGNQITLIEYNKKPIYFGSKTEIQASSSKVQIKQITNLLEKKLLSKSIKKVIIYGHAFADLDAIGAALGFYIMGMDFGKETYIQNITIDNTAKEAIENNLTKEEKNIFINKTKANKITEVDDTLVIIVDTSDIKRTENPEAFGGVMMDNIFIFDHHRVSNIEERVKKTHIYLDTKSSSTCEITSEIIQFMERKIKIPRNIAQMILNGIYLDTKQFTTSTSNRTFSAASWLESKGASTAKAAELLKLPSKHSKIINEITNNVKEIKPGYFLSTNDFDVETDIISLSADEILRVKGRKAAFVIAKLPSKKEYKLSARGINTNVQLIAESVGGGGNFNSAAATSFEEIKIFEDNLIQSIVSQKGDE